MYSRDRRCAFGAPFLTPFSLFSIRCSIFFLIAYPPTTPSVSLTLLAFDHSIFPCSLARLRLSIMTAIDYHRTKGHRVSRMMVLCTRPRTTSFLSISVHYLPFPFKFRPPARVTPSSPSLACRSVEYGRIKSRKGRFTGSGGRKGRTL